MQSSSVDDSSAQPAVIPPIPEPIPDVALEQKQIEVTSDVVDSEEEKRRARAIRFGLNPDEVASSDITITVKKLEHALPNRRYRPSWRQHKQQTKVVKH